jgi:hypothetical protein
MTNQPPALVWWLVWIAITGAFLATCTIFVVALRPVSPDGLLGLVALVPLSLAGVVRFAVLPALQDDRKRFVFFIIGLALSEGAGLVAMILGGPPRDYLAAAAIVLIILHAPPLLRWRAG